MAIHSSGVLSLQNDWQTLRSHISEVLCPAQLLRGLGMLRNVVFVTFETAVWWLVFIVLLTTDGKWLR